MTMMMTLALLDHYPALNLFPTPSPSRNQPSGDSDALSQPFQSSGFWELWSVKCLPQAFV